MFIESYKILYSADKLIPELNRNSYMTQEFMKLNKEYVESINVKGKVALLYVGGPAIHHSDGRNVANTSKNASAAIKSQIGYNVYNVARSFKNVSFNYVSSNANTCASSMHSLHEAKMLFDQGYTDIIVYGTDMVEDTQLLLFEQLGANVVCGDGSIVVHLTKDKTANSKCEVRDVSWVFNLDASPMSVSRDGYSKVIAELGVSEVDVVKPHGTGTDRNTVEELSALESVKYSNIVMYKEKIGHTQGISALLEICMLLEDDIEWRTGLALASGMGGFYGGCYLIKE
jgi:hypothetical protein